jgi:hypothetical protein
MAKTWRRLPAKTRICHLDEQAINAFRLGSVAGPVIQATGRSEFQDFVSGYSYHMSVRTRLSDHAMQTKFQSQRSSDVAKFIGAVSTETEI